jgi:xanthine dehydrogenase accessory factor
VVGQSPVAEALARLACNLSFDVVVADSEARAEYFPGAVAVLPDLGGLEPFLGARSYVVVATHGAHDHEALELALRSDAAYVALVASRRRAETIRAFLRSAGLAEERLARLKAPAGLDLGATEPAEIALSIAAEIVRVRRRGDGEIARRGDEEIVTGAPATAIDPVCGMAVEIATARHTAEHEGHTFYFCCPGCRYTFKQEPAKYLAVA